MTCRVPGPPAPVLGDRSGYPPFLLSPVAFTAQPPCPRSPSSVTFQVMSHYVTTARPGCVSAGLAEDPQEPLVCILALP